MKHLALLLALAAFLAGCASPVRFIQTDASYVVAPKPEGAEVVLRHERLQRPHRVVGVIEAELGRNASRLELDALLVKKAREVGADAVMLVEYDISRTVYYDRHRVVVGRRGRTYVRPGRRRVDVDKTAVGVAVVFR